MVLNRVAQCPFSQPGNVEIVGEEGLCSWKTASDPRHNCMESPGLCDSSCDRAAPPSVAPGSEATTSRNIFCYQAALGASLPGDGFADVHLEVSRNFQWHQGRHILCYA